MIKSINFNKYKEFRTDRREINEALEIAVRDSEISEAIHINSIRPVEDRFFKSKGGMSSAGHIELWHYLDDVVMRRCRNSPMRINNNPPPRPGSSSDFGIAAKAVEQRLQHLSVVTHRSRIQGTGATKTSFLSFSPIFH